MSAQFIRNIHWFVFAFVLLAFYFVFLALYTEFVPPNFGGPSTFSVTGEGKVQTKADYANVNVSIYTEEKTSTQAINKSNETLENIYKSLAILGVDKGDVQTTDFQVYPAYADKDSSVVTGQWVAVKLKIKVKNLDQVNKVTEAAYAVGVTQVDGIQYVTENNIQAENEARKKAFKQAQEKAQSMANLAGQRLGKLTYISDYTNTPVSDAQPQSSPGPVQSATTEVSISINLTYELK